MPPHVEDRLRTIWGEILGVSDFAGSNNFVELGGDSIAASTCLNRIQTDFGVEISLLSLLGEDSDFNSLAREIAALTAAGDYAVSATAANTKSSRTE